MLNLFNKHFRSLIFLSFWIVPLIGYTQSNSLDSGLVGYYPFDGNSTDKSGNGNHAENFGAYLTSDRFGRPDMAFLLDGTDDYFIIKKNNGLDISNMKEFSVSLWFNTSSGAPNYSPRILNIQDDKKYNLEIYIDKDNNELILKNYDSPNSTNNFELSVNSTIQKGVWYHIVLVFDFSSNETKMYLDGSLEAVENKNILVPGNPDYYLGTHRIRSWFFIGKIDDIRFYNRKLSSSEVSELYNASPTSIESYTTGKNKKSLVIYPNPVSNKLTMESNNGSLLSNGKFSLLNGLGEIVYSKKTLSDNKNRFNLTGLENGVYFY